MVDTQAELYDLAPMPVIIEEAGGRFTDLKGPAEGGRRRRAGHERADPPGALEASGAMSAGPRPVRAPRGGELSCKGWPQEAALRMLMNNLDPDVAEHPDNLVVYGGTGRAARSWDAFEAITASIGELEDDETLLVQSGKPVGVVRTDEWRPAS